uniref:Pyrrolidone-carboxylate peptidase n=1 Tax=Physcomitrium patens TaxID=3218 RepID=A0A7I4CLE0_PHYPA
MGWPLAHNLEVALSWKLQVHLGVNIASNNFSVERRAVNEATFGCSDELGWQPQRVPIVPEDGPTSFIRETTLPIRDIVSALSKEGFNVMESYDAGRFVCNYVYYHSLRHAQVSGVKSLFVHVPSFHFINQECQLEFIAALLKVLAMFC